MAKKKAGTSGTTGTTDTSGTSGTRGTAGTKGKKYVYFFGGGKAEGNREMRDTLGGKGSGLAEMTNAKLPVPPGFTISTEACTLYYQQGGKVPDSVDREMREHLKKLEAV